mgnify:CR=1 FL=1
MRVGVSAPRETTRCGAAHALQCNGADGSRRRQLQITALRHPTHQVAWHADVIGMVGFAGAGAGNPITNGEVSNAGAHGNDFACKRVADIPALVVKFGLGQAADFRCRHGDVDRFHVEHCLLFRAGIGDNDDDFC